MESRTDSHDPIETDTAERTRDRAYAAERAWHEAQAELPVKEKVAIPLRLQREILPILRSRRPLEPHERPWDILP